MVSAWFEVTALIDLEGAGARDGLSAGRVVPRVGVLCRAAVGAYSERDLVPGLVDGLWEP